MHENALRSQPFIKHEMSTGVFSRFSEFIYKKCGVKMPPEKKTMLTARLSKRLRHLGLTSFQAYYDYVTSSKGLAEELVHMINVVTTNKTDFWREPGHFDFLVNKALPSVIEMREVSNLNKLNVWSAGCSSGEEPYTLGIFLSEFFEKRHGDYGILATDISTRVLDAAKSAIYSKASIEPIPDKFRRKYLMRGKGSQGGSFRIVPELRKKIVFQRLNLLEGKDFGIRTKLDMIFCRNVIIYFDRPTQVRLFEKFYAQLRPGGFMFVGHSETLNNINRDFIPASNSVYRKPE